MHEMALAEGILAVVLEVADGQPVRQVRVRAGTLQRVVPDSLQFCFQLVAADTPAAEAVVALEEVAARIRCRRCGTEVDAPAPPFHCRSCGAPDVDLLSGDELLVDGVELDSGWRFRPGADEARALGQVSAEHLAEHAREDALAQHEPRG